MSRSLRHLACVLAGCAFLLVLAGCTKALPTQPTDTKRVVELENQLDGLRTLLVQPSITVEPEPKGSVTAGDYVGWVKDVSVGTTGVVASVDLLTDRHGHGNATNTVNRWPVIQRLAVPDAATLAVYAPGYGPLTVVTTRELAAKWKTQPELADTAYFVLISNGEVFAMWPANYPRSLPEVALN